MTRGLITEGVFIRNVEKEILCNLVHVTERKVLNTA